MHDMPSAGLSRRAFLKAGALFTASLAFPGRSLAAAPGRIYHDVPFHYQRHALTCEMAALRMAAEYHGVVKGEEDLLRLMARDPGQPRFENGSLVWADANRVFPGDITGWQLYRGGMQEHPAHAPRGEWGYGIHAPGIAEVAVRLGLEAELFNDAGDMYRALDRGWIPVVIVPDAGRTSTVQWRWFTPRGDAVAVMNAEHSVAVKGYDARRVWVNDPSRKVTVYDRGQFELAFRLLRSGVAVGPPSRRWWRRQVAE